MDIDAVRTWIANTTLTVSGIRSASPYPLDTIPPTPCAVVGPMKVPAVLHGEWERVHLEFPLRIYVGRLSDSARTTKLIDGFIPGLIAAFRLGGTETGTVASSLLDNIDAALYEDIGSERYQVIDATVNVIVNSATGYTP